MRKPHTCGKPRGSIVRHAGCGIRSNGSAGSEARRHSPGSRAQRSTYPRFHQRNRTGCPCGRLRSQRRHAAPRARLAGAVC